MPKTMLPFGMMRIEKLQQAVNLLKDGLPLTEEI
jgi:hypothetical protein